MPCAQMLKFLDYHPETHSRVMRDAVRAYIIVWLFSSKAPAFFNSKAGSKFKSSKLFTQEERSKEPPDRRSGQSCRYRDDSFYHDLDKQLVDYQRGPFKDDYSELPYEWDMVIRPKIAQCMLTASLSLSNLSRVVTDMRGQFSKTGSSTPPISLSSRFSEQHLQRKKKDDRTISSLISVAG